MSAPQGKNLPWPRVARDILRQSVPNVTSFFLLLLPETLNVLFIAHAPSGSTTRATGTAQQQQIKTDALAAVGLGNCILNCVGLAVGMGLNQAMDSFVSTSYGAGDLGAALRYLAQSQAVILTLVPTVCFPVLYFGTHPLLQLCRQPASVSLLASEYCGACSLGLLPALLADTYRRFFANIPNGTAQIQTSQLAITALHVVVKKPMSGP